MGKRSSNRKLTAANRAITIEFSDGSASTTFTITVPVATPSSFVWRRIESNWDEDGDGAVPWERLSQVYARKVPGYAGDRIRFELWGYWNSNNIDYGSNAVLRLDHDVAIGNIDVTGGYGHHIRFLAESGTPVFSFDNNGQPSIFEIDSASEVSFGAQDNSLVMNLNNPVTIRRGGSYGFNLNFYAQITGGDSEHPSDLIIEQNANEWGNLYGRLLNSANTFTGNIILKRVNKGYLTFYVGSAAYPAENGMLGAASNEIRMSNGPTLVFCGSSAVVPSCSRTVRGRGTLTARNGDNKMALDYFMGQMLLKGEVPQFMQYMGWVQRYGGYEQIPAGYADIVQLMKSNGNVPGSPYLKYIKQRRNNE